MGGDLRYVSVREHRGRVSPRGRRPCTAERDGEEEWDREGVRERVRWTEGEGIEGDGEGIERDGEGIERDGEGIERDAEGIERDGEGIERDGEGIERDGEGIERDGEAQRGMLRGRERTQ